MLLLNSVCFWTHDNCRTRQNTTDNSLVTELESSQWASYEKGALIFMIYVGIVALNLRNIWSLNMNEVSHYGFRASKLILYEHML